MAKSLFSSSWYRVADLKPRIRAHAQIHRQQFRGETRYVLQDHQSGQFHRLSPAAHQLICMMDGRRTVREIWERLSTRLSDGEEQPTQDETIHLLSQLHNSDLLHGAVPPNMTELSDRSERKQRRDLLMRVKNPMALRLPIFDPERFLTLTLPLIRPIFTKIGFALWLCLVAFGALLAVMHWEAFTTDVTANAFTAQNLILFAATYSVVKAIHELGHGYATKVWGGEVHEMGIMLLVLMPVPYVDASAASAFQQKRRRALVASAGIMVEALLAALAMIFWVLAEPGLARSAAFNVILIGGVSTLLFNGNPLLRFDGYYALCDLIEIPNLATRANRYFFYLIRRNAFRIDGEESPVTARGEAPWFFFYAVAAFVYRLFIMVGIALFIASQLFFAGIALAIMAVFNSLILPILKGIKYLMANPSLRHHRRRAIGVSAATGICIAIFFGLPVPYSTVSQGVVQLPDNASVPALTNGFIAEVKAQPGNRVAKGMPLILMQDPELAGRLAIQEKELEELRLRERVVQIADRVQARLFTEQIRHAEADIALTKRRLADLTIRAEKSGWFIVPGAADLPGRFAQKGSVLGYVVAPGDPVVRVVVDQADIDLVRRQTRRVTASRVEDVGTVVDARIIREVPMAQTELPSAALGTQGGGEIVLDPQSPEKPKAFEGLFNFDLVLAETPERIFIGSRVHVRFDHGTEPLAFRVARTARQLFLSQFGI